MKQDSFLSEEQLARLQEELPLIPVERVEALHLLFKQLQRSERFLFFRRVPFAKLCISEWVEDTPAVVWTLEDMITRGALDVCIGLSVTPERLTEISQVFSRLVAGEESVEAQAKNQGGQESPSETEEKPEESSEHGRTSWEHRKDFRAVASLPAYSSVEANRLLTEALSRLRREKDLDQLKEAFVEQFWDAEIARGPFLEELSFLELSDLTAEHILKKRSFTGTKLHLLLQSIEGFLGSAQSSPTSRTFQHSSKSRKSTGKNVIIFPSSQPHLSLSELAMLALLERITEERSRKSDPLLSVLVFLERKAFLPRLCAMIVAEQQAIELATPLACDDMIAELRALLEEMSHSFLKHLKTLLLGSGCSQEQLVAEYDSPELGHELSTVMIRLILRSIGAVELFWKQSPGKRFWSLRADSFEHLERAIHSRLPASEEELQTFFRFLAPHLPESMLADLLRMAPEVSPE